MGSASNPFIGDLTTKLIADRLLSVGLSLGSGSNALGHDKQSDSRQQWDKPPNHSAPGTRLTWDKRQLGRGLERNRARPNIPSPLNRSQRLVMRFSIQL